MGSARRIGSVASVTIRGLVPGVRKYCEPHRHDVDEINILLSQGHLLYDIRLGDERYEVEAPASVYIPAGLVHSANVIEGSGFFVAVIASARYEALPPPR